MVLAHPVGCQWVLDFNYIAKLERDSMLEDRSQYEAAICEMAERKGFLIQQSADAFARRKIYCSYRSVLGPLERIEVDLNYLFLLPLSKPMKRELWCFATWRNQLSQDLDS